MIGGPLSGRPSVRLSRVTVELSWGQIPCQLMIWTEFLPLSIMLCIECSGNELNVWISSNFLHCVSFSNAFPPFSPLIWNAPSYSLPQLLIWEGTVTTVQFTPLNWIEMELPPALLAMRTSPCGPFHSIVWGETRLEKCALSATQFHTRIGRFISLVVWLVSPCWNSVWFFFFSFFSVTSTTLIDVSYCAKMDFK